MSKFKPGISGNPSGRPKKDTANLAAKLKKHGATVLQVVIDQALNGDLTACRLILDRLYPPIKPAAAHVKFSQAEGGSISDSARGVIVAMSAGAIAPDVANQIISSLANLSKIVETDELQRRLEILEAKHES